MSKIDLPKTYNPQAHEDAVYQDWEASGFFNPDQLPPRSDGQERTAYSIMLPPPNATGTLHVGHAMYTVEDVLIRQKRMAGFAPLWLPGTDHAAIATNAKVERLLRDKGMDRKALGREKFLKEVDVFLKNSQGTIKHQLRKMGFSLDWSREAYTFDKPRSRNVRLVFKRMYDDGLIYRGQRIVNWCPQCESTLADDEVEYTQEKAKFYYLKYGPVIIGTARPETKFLDKVIVVHPEDKRYADLVGHKFMVPWIDGQVEARVITDDTIDMNFGSGAMTITPAHDIHDFDLAQKHGIEIVQIIDHQGNFTSAAGFLAGKNARESRNAILEKLRAQGLLDHVDENYVHNLSVCYRCATAIEPLISQQWFIDVNKPFGEHRKSLKELSLEVVRTGQIQFVPDRFSKIYFHWMENLRDWCISRQIWFGHQIPVWYKGEEVCVGEEAPEGAGWKQDEDTLDTWFSSAMWTFSTLGWENPEINWQAQTSDFNRFHPTDVLETGYDIIFFWVARMILMTEYALQDLPAERRIPFKTVYLHGLVRDEKGRKMSKSLGNILDPLDVSATYGTDALRLSLILGSTPGNDIKISETKIAGYRNFVNKLWNTARFVASRENLREDGAEAGSGERAHSGASNTLVRASRPEPSSPSSLPDLWIQSKTQRLISEVTKDFETFALARAGERLYDFVWHDLADWYLESTKASGNYQVLKHTLETCLKLLHPFIPFVTEVIWRSWHTDFLMVTTWPTADVHLLNEQAEKDFEDIQAVVTHIRNIRAEYAVPAGNWVDIWLDTPLAEGVEALVSRLARVKIQVGAGGEENSIDALAGGRRVMIPLAGLMDVKREAERLSVEQAEMISYIENIKRRLASQDYTTKAPASVVERDRQTLTKKQAALQVIQEKIAQLEKLSF